MVLITPSEILSQLRHISDDRSSAIILSHAICISLAFLAVILRFTSRRIGHIPLKADDYLIIGALVLGLGEVIGGLLCVRYGGGKHAVLLQDPARFAKSVLATEVLYNPAIACVKFSVLLLYRRIFHSKTFRLVLNGVGGLIFTYTCIAVITSIFQCRPVQAAWDMSITDAVCIKLNVEVVVFAILNAMTDLATMCLPMPLLWRLQMETGRKLQLMGLFLAGGLYVITSLPTTLSLVIPKLGVSPC